MAHRKAMLVIACSEANPYKSTYHDILLEFET